MSHIVLSGPSLTSYSPSKGFMIAGSPFFSNFGWSVSSAGDVNKDGYADVIIGACGRGTSRGAAYVIYGGLSLPDIDLYSTDLGPSTTGFRITGQTPDDEFGYSVHGAGDINKDEYHDIIIGAYGKNSKQGAAYVVYGGPKSSMSNIDLSIGTLSPLTTGFMITGNAPNDFFGDVVSNAGDVNKDGYGDIIIGAYSKNNSKGAVYLIYGGSKSSISNIDLSTGTLNPLTTGFMITGNAEGDSLGAAVSCAGDVNNDGYNDTIIGAHNKGSGNGAAYVIYGREKVNMSNIDLSTTDLDPLTRGFSIFGETNNAQVGRSVSAGYINKDKYSDLLIGAPLEKSNTGTAYFVFSQCSAYCEQCSSVSTCIICSKKYALVNSLCEQCPTNCELCTDGTSCVVCSGLYVLYGGQCWVTCPLATFTRDMEKCEDCPEGCSECTNKSTCQTCIPGYTLTKSNLCEKEIDNIKVKEKDGEKVAAGVFEGTSLAGAALGSGSSLPFNFGLVAKIIRNFKYMKLPASRELYETFVSWKVASGFMSAPESWSEKYSSKGLPVVFSRYKLQSAFLINFWKPFSMALIGIAIFGVFKVIEVSIKNKKSMMFNFSKQVHIAASNFALTQFYSNLDDVIFYFIIEMRSTEFETGFRVGSSLLAIVLFLVGGIFIGLHSKFIAKYQTLKTKGTPKQFEAKCENISLIFKDFKDTNSLIQSFLMINVARSVVASLIFATFFEYPMIQISLLFVLNILMIVYLLKKKSFKEFTNTCGQMFCEVVLFIANICVFLLALFDHAESYPIASIERLGKCIIILNYILLFGCALLLLFSLGKSLYQSYLERKKPQQPPLSSADKKILTSEKFNRPDPGLDQSHSTNIGLINESQDNSRFDSYQNNALALKSVNGKLERNFKMGHQQGKSQKDSVQNRLRKQNYKEGFDKSGSSNVVLQSSQIVEDFEEEARQPNLFSNVLPRSRLVRNREVTQARITQFKNHFES